MNDDDGDAIRIKFGARYCEAHSSSQRLALHQKIHPVVRLSGGLLMIIMDDIGEDYENLFYFVQEHPDSLSAEKGARNLLSEKIRVCVLKLHQAGFVHGDIRDIC